MKLTRLFILCLTMVVAIAWVGLSVGASFHHHDHGGIVHDCPWCSVANFQLVLIDFDFGGSIDTGVPASLYIAHCVEFASSDFLTTLAPRAPPTS